MFWSSSLLPLAASSLNLLIRRMSHDMFILGVFRSLLLSYLIHKVVNNLLCLTIVCIWYWEYFNVYFINHCLAKLYPIVTLRALSFWMAINAPTTRFTSSNLDNNQWYMNSIDEQYTICIRGVMGTVIWTYLWCIKLFGWVSKKPDAIYYTSHTLNKAQVNYTLIEEEFLNLKSLSHTSWGLMSSFSLTTLP